MWAALRSDLKEFVSTVADEGTTVLSAIDSKLQDEEVRRRLQRDKEDGGDDIEEDGDEEEEEEGGSSNFSGEEDEEEEGSDSPRVLIGEDGDVTYIDRRGGYEATGVVSAPLDEVARLRGLEETYTRPLLSRSEDEDAAAAKGKTPRATTAVLASGEARDSSEADRKEAGSTDAAVEEETVGTDEDGGIEVTEESEDTDQSSGVPEDPEYDTVRAFLSTFDVASKTHEISLILEKHPNTVREHFENLVPTVVTYEQFWRRYFYRCDPVRIERMWEAEREAARKARVDAISGGLNSVKSLFGGAVRAVSHIGVGGGGGGHKSTYEKYQADLQQQRAMQSGVGVGSSFFGPGRRPPFVMNTAVSDVDDEEDEEDDEEELGWDDDDEEDEEDGDDEEADEEEVVGGSDEEGEIVFGSPGRDSAAAVPERLDDLRRQLSQVEAERDQLHQTVEMQAKEIAELHLRQKDASSSKFASSEGENKEEIEKLKMTIFEKDSEIAALKASLDDTHEDEHGDSGGLGSSFKKSAAKIAAQEREMERMSAELDAKNGEILRLRDEKSAASAALEEAQMMIATLQSDLEKAREEANRSSVEAEKLREELSSSKDGAVVEMEAARREAQVAHEQIVTLKSELDQMKHQNDFTTRRADHLDEEVRKLREELEHRDVQFAKTLEEEVAKVRVEQEEKSASSFSSGVKLPSPSEAVSSPSQLGAISKVNANDDDEDDWGDAWGDEDD